MDLRMEIARLIVSAQGDDPDLINEQLGGYAAELDAADQILERFDVRPR